jgi:energy-converting hydrogenase Eha subunit A
MKFNVPSAIRTAKSVITANSPVLLVGTAVAGVIATGVLAAKGGYQARGIIDAAREEKDGVEPTLPEKFSLTWLCFAAPVLTATSTVASVIGVHAIHTKRYAALAGLYAIATSKLDDMSAKAEEALGSNKKVQQFRDDLSQLSVERGDEFEDNEVIITGNGTELCFDEHSGRWFMSSHARLESAVNDLNHALLSDNRSLNEFYDYIGLQGNSAGRLVGWNSGTKVSPKFSSVLTSDGRPAISFGFREEPRLDAVR